MLMLCQNTPIVSLFGKQSPSRRYKS